MENCNTCGTYDINGTYSNTCTPMKINEKFGNPQSIHIELEKIAKPMQNDGSCDPYDPSYPYDKCFLESKKKFNTCS